MQGTMLASLSGLGDFCKYFVAALAFTLIFSQVYCWVTPYDELKMVREGKIAPAITFGGAMLGFVLPLASAITNSVGLLDMLIWAVIALLIQIAIFRIVCFFFKDLVREIENDHIAAAILLAFFSVAIGIINAASMTY